MTTSEEAARWQVGFKEYAKLWRLSRKRIQSEEDYREFQAFQAQLVLDYLAAFGVKLAGQRVLDLGSGIGGYSEHMARQGATVISVDLMAAAVSLDNGCSSVVGNALHLPLDTHSMDFVFCASLIEHVPNPLRLLQEVARVLKPGGFCYLSFPPFYSPVGGHEYAPFHYLGEEWAMRLAGNRSQKGHPEWAQRLYPVNAQPTSFAGIYADWGLFVMTIAKGRQLISQSGMNLLDQSTRYFPHSFARWPLLGELLTWHVQFLLQQPASDALHGS
jgi:SAM-dependent methyltransferase